MTVVVEVDTHYWPLFHSIEELDNEVHSVEEMHPVDEGHSGVDSPQLEWVAVVGCMG